MAHVVTTHFQTTPVLQRIVRKQVAAAASAVGALGDDAGRVELAVGEAFANAHKHAYGGTPGPVELEISCEPNRFAIAINDEGEGLSFEPRIPNPPDPRTGNGYGLQVIKAPMDEVGLQHPGPRDEAQRFVWRLACRSLGSIAFRPDIIRQIRLFGRDLV